MRPFLTSKRKLLDLIVLLVLAVVVGFLQGVEAALMFSSGFIWNWVGSQDLTQFMEGRNYKFTTLRFVLNLQSAIVTAGPLKRAPDPVKMILRCLPAGLFWLALIWFFDSDLPAWPAFLGSLCFELSQWEVLFRKKEARP
jgi:hypothetical protein